MARGKPWAFRKARAFFLQYTQRQEKIAAIHVTAWRFGHEDLVKTIFIVKVR
jgi:hypothetical protein